jgi:putative transcriptional regulator
MENDDLSSVLSSTIKRLDQAGLVDKKTMRDFNELDFPEFEKLSAKQALAIREQEHVSRSVFARYLNVSEEQIKKIEQGRRVAQGATLTLLNLVKEKGLNYINPH